MCRQIRGARSGRVTLGGRHGLHRERVRPVASRPVYEPGTICPEPAIGLLESRSQPGISVALDRHPPRPPDRASAAASRRRKKLLSAFLSAFRTPDLRKKLLFTVGIIAVYRLGATLPSPGVSYANVQKCLDAVQGARHRRRAHPAEPVLRRRAAAAVGLRARHHAVHHGSIILQLLTVVIPRLEQLRKEGQSGQAKITQYTRYLTLGPGDPAVLGLRGAGPLRPAVPATCATSSRSSPRTPACRTG